MEIFIPGLPERTIETQLTKYFRQILEKLSIKDFYCKKRKGKKFGFLTFLNLVDGQTFLRSYAGTNAAKLVFQGRILYCRRSNKPPNELDLKSLKWEAKARDAQTADHPENNSVPKSSTESAGSLECSSISCGVWTYHGSDSRFRSYLDWRVHGTIKFGPKLAIIRMDTGKRIDIDYSAIEGLVGEGLPNSALIFTLTSAPSFFQDIGTTKNDGGVESLLESMFSNLTMDNERGPSRERVPGLSAEHEKIAGSCLVYRIGLVGATFEQQIKAQKRARGIPSTIRWNTSVLAGKTRFEDEMDKIREAFLQKPYNGLPFPVLFQMQKLAQNSYLSPSRVIGLLPEIVALMSRCSAHTCVQVIRRLLYQLPFRGPDADFERFQLRTLVGLIRQNEQHIETGGVASSESNVSQSVAIIHRVLVTPAGIYLEGPDPENKNRVLRKYPDHHDYFIRVQFCDEDFSPVRYAPGVSNDPIFEQRFKKILKDGIHIGGRQYAFLGFSHSSLRAQSCWFMAPFFHGGQLLFDRLLITGLGDFSHIRCPAKCAARIGQAFSETPTAVTVAEGVARTTLDVKRNGRVFSDGVGTVSMSVLEQIWGALPEAKKKQATCFQIRYSGAKGMISLDSRLNDESLFLRESMVKFPGSDSTDIEICGGAYKPLPLFLNHQSIKILEDMGVSEDFFFHWQKEGIERLRKVASSSADASKYLKSQSIGEAARLSWFIKKLDNLNLSFQADDFLRDIVELAVFIELRALKYKARIPVKDGYTLYGIMDETGIVKEGQVFCTVEDDEGVRTVTGKNLIITRSPALHPGDIQLATGIDVPADSPLRQLRNCICFSQHGARDLPSQLSGGDLDGDLYNVIFDSRAKPKRIFTPADYPAQTPVDLKRSVKKEDMTDFFVTFMATDQLGRIANLHKILADQREDGTLDPDCLKLAELHSNAVDYSKSGVPINLNEIPRGNRYRPDFMAPGPDAIIEKNKPVSLQTQSIRGNDQEDDDDEGFLSYRYLESEKILGKLYRAIDEREFFDNAQSQGPPRLADNATLLRVWAYVQRQCQAFQWEHHLARARGIREEYEFCLSSIASEYSIRPSRPLTELEVFVGNILGKNGAQNKRQHELSISMKQRFNEDLTYIVSCIIMDGPEGENDNLERSIACFKAGLETRPEGSKTDRGWESFQYVAAAVCLREVERVFGQGISLFSR